MNPLKLTLAAFGAAALLATVSTARAQSSLFITEVDTNGSGTSSYAQDWFELTNIGSAAINIAGWKMDDSSDSFGSAVALKGVSSIAAGQTIVFVEDTGETSNDASLDAAFENAWFGGASDAPAGFTIGNYGGSGVGLSNNGDAVNIFNASGVQEAGVEFGDADQNKTFDNAKSLISNDGTISTLSSVGTDHATTSADGEIGSPGLVPEPGAGWLVTLGSAGLALAAWTRHRLAA